MIKIKILFYWSVKYMFCSVYLVLKYHHLK